MYELASTIAETFHKRVKATPDAVAYCDYRNGDWQQYTWQATLDQVARWQQAMLADGLNAGDRIAIMCENRWEWVICDQAAQGLGLITVPIYTSDRTENIKWVLQDSGAQFLLVQTREQWRILQNIIDHLGRLARIVSLEALHIDLPNLLILDDWLSDKNSDYVLRAVDPDNLATIVYTSGTTGKPKGVMLSHRNILWNVDAALRCVAVHANDVLLSFLPLSHTLERTTGYYLPIVTGSQVVYSRSIKQLADDLLAIKPTIMVSVPRIFERVYGKITSKLATEPAIKQKLFHTAVALGWQRFEYEQGRRDWSPRLLLQPILDALVGKQVRAKLGGRLRFTVCGGAALSADIAEVFIGLGIPILQGYGLTETSPVISANCPQNNLPKSVGKALPGVEVQISADGELLARSPSVMLGYWQNQQATAETIDPNGWLYTGDKATIDTEGYIQITGRLKEIIVLSTGEKVPPADMENAIALDPWIEQVMVIGEAKPYLTALVVPETETFEGLHDRSDKALNELFLQRVKQSISAFPGYAKIERIMVITEPWTPDNGLLTPTLKLRRQQIAETCAQQINELYKGH
jgi:long-chain acyl-CoA synthetase